MTAIDQTSNPITGVIELGRFQIDLDSRALRLDGASVTIGSRAFDILVALVSANGRVVTKDELLNAVWPKTIVEESNIHVHLSALRKILGPDRNLVLTVPGRGYRICRQKSGPDVSERARGSRSVLRAKTSLIGREPAIRKIGLLLNSSRQVTLVGAGGIGKTELALEVVRRARDDFSGPIYIAELSALMTRESVLAAIVAACVPVGDVTARSVESVACAVSDCHGILLIDNAEHVVGHVAEVVEALLDSAENLRILVTSREPLRIISESVFRVDPLETPPIGATDADILHYSAVALFWQRANAIQGALDLESRHIQLAGEICRRLDGIPLAIELAAARVAALGLESVRRGLDDRMDFLKNGFRTALPRHQTLLATFDWSHASLGCDERALFRRIAVFDGAFNLDEMCFVAGDVTLTPERALTALEELVAKSLVNVRRVGAQVCYQMYESTRAYALQKLHSEGEAELVASRREHQLNAGHERPARAYNFDERWRIRQPLAGGERDCVTTCSSDASPPTRQVWVQATSSKFLEIHQFDSQTPL